MKTKTKTLVIYQVEFDDNRDKLKTDTDGEDFLGVQWLKISKLNKTDLSPFAMMFYQKSN